MIMSWQIAIFELNILGNILCICFWLFYVLAGLISFFLLFLIKLVFYPIVSLYLSQCHGQKNCVKCKHSGHQLQQIIFIASRTDKSPDWSSLSNCKTKKESEMDR